MYQHRFLPYYGQMKIFLQNSFFFVSAVEKKHFFLKKVSNIHSTAVSFSIKSNISCLTFILLYYRDFSTDKKQDQILKLNRIYRSMFFSNLSTPAAFSLMATRLLNTFQTKVVMAIGKIISHVSQTL